MHNLLTGIARLLERGYDYRGSVCIVDATSFLDHVDVLTAVENQILSSNFIVMNKTDLAPEEQQRAVADKIRELNPEAALVGAVQAEVPFDVLSVELRDNGIDGETTNRPETRPTCYTVLTRMSTVETSAVEALLKTMAPRTLRIKGFMKTSDGLLLVDAVGLQIQLRRLERKEIHVEPARFVLVFIGRDTTPFKDELKAAWKEHLKENPIFMR
jgi:G3E family GTPase